MPIRLSLRFDPDISQYKKSNCPENPITIAIFGQSNSANYVRVKSDVVIPSNLYQYDWKSQSCYLYKEPLLGASGTKGNVITYTAIKMANNSRKPIVIIPFGVGGTSVLEWAYGDLSHQHQIVMKRIKESGLSPIIFLWHQGESDSQTISVSLDEITKVPYFQKYYNQKGNRRGMIPLTEDVYYNALKKVVGSTFKSYPQSSFGIALATLCRNTPWNPVRSAQARISQDLPNTFISADSDKITGFDKRPGNCHFSTKGASELGNLYYESIIKEIKKNIGT
ncbi:MAG: hypothetical protein JJ844_03815 [Prochlorococcus marinus CUG1435]|nr:hypothetical protein [Prochlorococcus marinus CUG1435]